MCVAYVFCLLYNIHLWCLSVYCRIPLCVLSDTVDITEYAQKAGYGITIEDIDQFLPTDMPDPAHDTDVEWSWIIIFIL